MLGFSGSCAVYLSHGKGKIEDDIVVVVQSKQERRWQTSCDIRILHILDICIIIGLSFDIVPRRRKSIR